VCRRSSLEDHLRTTRGDDGASSDGEEDDEEAWEGWEIESKSSDDSSDSRGWIDVKSGGEDHLSVSDSDSEHEKSRAQPLEHDGPSSDANRPDINARNDKGVLKSLSF
jgi:protein SDA1